MIEFVIPFSLLQSAAAFGIVLLVGLLARPVRAKATLYLPVFAVSAYLAVHFWNEALVPMTGERHRAYCGTNPDCDVELGFWSDAITLGGLAGLIAIRLLFLAVSGLLEARFSTAPAPDTQSDASGSKSPE